MNIVTFTTKIALAVLSYASKDYNNSDRLFQFGKDIIENDLNILHISNYIDFFRIALQIAGYPVDPLPQNTYAYGQFWYTASEHFTYVAERQNNCDICGKKTIKPGNYNLTTMTTRDLQSLPIGEKINQQH